MPPRAKTHTGKSREALNHTLPGVSFYSIKDFLKAAKATKKIGDARKIM